MSCQSDPPWSCMRSIQLSHFHDKTNKLTVDSEDSDQTGRMPRLMWVFARRTCHFVGFVMSWINSC